MSIMCKFPFCCRSFLYCGVWYDHCSIFNIEKKFTDVKTNFENNYKKYLSRELAIYFNFLLSRISPLVSAYFYIYME